MSRQDAVISIGTNSTRVLLADLSGERPRTVLALATGTRVGEGLRERGELGEEPVRRTLEAVQSHFERIRGQYDRLSVIATSAVRRAQNGETFAAEIKRITGAKLRVLSGDEEAQASYRGAISEFGHLHGAEVGVVDTGGGSTEYAIGRGTHAERTVSCEVGAVRLTERVPELAGHDGALASVVMERAREYAREALEPIARFRAIDKLAIVGGSAMTAAAVIHGGVPGERFDLTRSDLAHALSVLCALVYERRKDVPGMNPQRADILPAGMIIIDTILEMLTKDRAVATSSDLLLGYLLQQRDQEDI